jgi:hypothetical protein
MNTWYFLLIGSLRVLYFVFEPKYNKKMAQDFLDHFRPKDPNIPRIIDRMPGEVSGLRPIEFHYEDIKRYRDLDKSLPVEFGEPLKDNEIASELNYPISFRLDDAKGTPEDRAKEKPKGELEYLFGVAGMDAVAKDDIGELQGWVYYSKDHYAKTIKRKGILPSETDLKSVYAVSYAKIKDAPPHQMASALRQSLTIISQKNALRMARAAEKRKQDLMVKIHGIPPEQQSEEIKKLNEREVEKGNYPDLIVLAYIETENIESMNVAKYSGFEKIGSCDLESPHDAIKRKKDIYMLNWETLNRLEHEKADPILFPKSSKTANMA